MTLYEFIKLTPDHWPHPDELIIQDYHDKDYDLDWDFGKDKMVNITVSMSGDLGWDAKVNGVSVSGTAKNPKAIPSQIFSIFKDLGYDAVRCDKCNGTKWITQLDSVDGGLGGKADFVHLPCPKCS
jgi:hypothetical protein